MGAVKGRKRVTKNGRFTSEDCKQAHPQQPISKKSTPSWLEIVWKSVYQMYLDSGGKREYFHYNSEICTYIDENWYRFAPGKDRTSTWTNTVSSTITTNRRVFKTGPEQGLWGLRMPPFNIDQYKKEMAAFRKSKEHFVDKTAIPKQRKKRAASMARTYKDIGEEEDEYDEDYSEDNTMGIYPRDSNPTELPVENTSIIVNSQSKFFNPYTQPSSQQTQLQEGENPEENFFQPSSPCSSSDALLDEFLNSDYMTTQADPQFSLEYVQSNSTTNNESLCSMKNLAVQQQQQTILTDDEDQYVDILSVSDSEDDVISSNNFASTPEPSSEFDETDFYFNDSAFSQDHFLNLEQFLDLQNHQ